MENLVDDLEALAYVLAFDGTPRGSQPSHQRSRAVRRRPGLPGTCPEGGPAGGDDRPHLGSSGAAPSRGGPPHPLIFTAAAPLRRPVAMILKPRDRLHFAVPPERGGSEFGAHRGHGVHEVGRRRARASRTREDTDGGFAHAGSSHPFFDPDVMGSAFDDAMTETDGLLFGRRTWQKMAAAWPERPGDTFATR